MTYEEFEARYDYNPNTDRIGGGGFGQVYKARDTVRKRWVAIKECKVEPNKFTLEREVRIVAELGHNDNIARYENNYRFKLGRVEMDYAVMHYYEEGSLATVLANYTLSDTERIEIVKGLLAGLGFIHREGFIHRDFKPGNVLMLKENGRWIPKITDFGMSKLKKGTGDVTNNSATAKTLAYSAPEQLQNRPIKDNTDLWAFGVTVYKMCTGRLPYTSDATTSRETYNLEISGQIVSGKLPDMTGIKEPFRSLIERCLVFDMDQRVQSAGELMVLFDDSKPLEKEEKTARKKVVEEATDVGVPIIPPNPTPITPSPHPPIPPSNNTWKWIVGAAVVLCKAILGIKAISTPKSEEETTMLPDSAVAMVDTTAAEVDEGPIPMVYVPGGTFEMGDVFGEGNDNEKPVHSVTVSSFKMGKYEVTQAQWQAVMGNNPSEFKNCDNCPVENVSWEDVQTFIKKLNAQTGKNYRLPTEAEWEYAARGGGKKVRFGNGKDILDPAEANFDASASFKEAYSKVGVYRGKPIAVGSFGPNSLGLYDMTGNVCEWCSDWYGAYSSDSQRNPTGRARGSIRVIRGGSCGNRPQHSRVAARIGLSPSDRYSFVGFRLVSP